MLLPHTIKMYLSTATKPVQGAVEVSDAIAVSSTLTYYSQPISLADVNLLGVQWETTGTPTGTFTLEISNDGRVPDYWEVIQAHATAGITPTWTAPNTGGAFPTAPAGSATSGCETFGNLGYAYARVKYVNASGSGTIRVRLAGKR